MRSIYLDYSTTTPVAASVREAMLPFLSEYFGHPQGSHWFCRAAQEAIEDARSSVASLLDCHPNEIVFTAGGTESVNIGIVGAARKLAQGMRGRPHLISTKLEHPCVFSCLEQLKREGWDVTLVGCDTEGTLDIHAIESAIRPETRLMSVVLANSRIGTLQPIAEISELCKQHHIVLHTDACQAIGKEDCSVRRLGVDMLSLSGHKFYAPKGIGALYLRSGLELEPLLYGDGCEFGIRPGTANVPFIAALGQAAKLALAGLDSTLDQTRQMRDQVHQQLESTLGVELRVHGFNARRLPNILSFELPHVRCADIQQRLPELCLGAAHCVDVAAGQMDATHKAIGLTPCQSRCTLRISLGWNTSKEELQQAVQVIATAYEALTSEGEA